MSRAREREWDRGRSTLTQSLSSSWMLLGLEEKEMPDIVTKIVFDPKPNMTGEPAVDNGITSL
jgi:hypothetical protein